MMENKSGNLATGIYVRVSTEEQAQEGYSVRGQTEKLKAYALLKGWDIFDIYADEGISGKNIVDRPEINRLIDDINEGKVNNVLVFKVDRLTRSTKNLLELVELFEENDCAFNSLMESIDTETPSGRMFLKIIGIFAEFERENLVSRLKLGFERKAKEGYTLANSVISYGYAREKGQKIQEVQPDEARIVKEMFNMFVDENISMHGIAKALNERKIPTKMKTGTWGAKTIRGMLMNPTYIGKVRYSVTDKSKYFEADGHHESIISDELFYQAQEKISNTPQILRTKRPKEESYFCGVLACGMCGGKFTTHNTNKPTGSEEKRYHRSYKCSNKISNTIACKCPQITHEKMESAFSEYIQKINDLLEDKEININDTAKNEEQEILGAIVDYEKKLGILQDRKHKIMEQYVNVEIEFDEYKQMLHIMNERMEAVETELQRKKAELSNISDTANILPEDIVLNLKQNWETLNNKERMIFLQRFVKKITIIVEKEKTNSNIVKIEGIEFNAGIEPLEKNKKSRIKSLLSNRRNLSR